MVHLHLCGYETLEAKYALLAAAKLIAALPAEQRDAVFNDGHREGDLLLAALSEAHGGAGEPAHLPRGAPSCEVELPEACCGLRVGQLRAPQDEMARLLAEAEASWEADRSSGVASWVRDLDAAVAGSELSLERVGELVAAGTAALGVDASLFGVTGRDAAPPPLEPPLARLKLLTAEHCAAKRWHRRHGAVLTSQQPLAQMRAALREADAADPPLRLAEARALRTRLEQAEAWLRATRRAWWRRRSFASCRQRRAASTEIIESSRDSSGSPRVVEAEELRASRVGGLATAASLAATLPPPLSSLCLPPHEAPLAPPLTAPPPPPPTPPPACRSCSARRRCSGCRHPRWRRSARASPRASAGWRACTRTCSGARPRAARPLPS